MKYKFSTIKYWKSWFKQDISRMYYKYVHHFNVDLWNGTMMPDCGKGKFVSVYVKGEIIEIIDETKKYDTIRIIPYQPNHGVMIERIKDGKMIGRNRLSIDDFNEMFNSEV